jgi:hypothetical protein
MRLSGVSGLLCLIGLVSVVGCGRSGPAKVIPDKSVPVTGTITLEGKPLGNARVTFYPTEGSQGEGVASGTTDSTGKYELQSLFGDKVVIGAAPGKYKVTVSQLVRPDGTPMPADSKEPPIMSAARESVTMEHSAFDRTELTANVSSTGGTFNFDVKPMKAAL